jgi:phage tail sheath protein FI
VWTGKSKTSNKFNRDYPDLNRNKSDGLSSQLNATDQTGYQFIFTLDEIVSGSSNGLLTWVSGSRAGGTSLSSVGSNDYKNVIDYGVDRFTMPLYGGSDGLDITEKDPFRNTLLEGKTETNNYAYNSVKEAIDITRDPEFVPYNLVSVPGITNEQLTTHLINTAEARADALAVIDLKGDFQPSHEGNSGKTYPVLSTTITNLKDRQINSSYGCAYYPFVQIRDTLQGQLVYMPASVAAIGAMSYTDRVRAPWFEPAGFNRGGLSSGVAGLPVVNVTEKLTSQDRDLLYDANINPIASFPNEGIVIFGQKTLQVTRSALDRINVRRLMIFIKKGISNIAAGVLFEPNVRATWARFIGQANPFLSDVQARFGLDDFKLVLDETTTTPDLIDRNILYAKVYLKPTRAIEFVAVDFIISNTGASFED